MKHKNRRREVSCWLKVATGVAIALAYGSLGMCGEEASSAVIERQLRLGGVVYGDLTKGAFALVMGEQKSPLRKEHLLQYVRDIVGNENVIATIKQEEPGTSCIAEPEKNGVDVPNKERGVGNLLTQTAIIAEELLAQDTSPLNTQLLSFYCRHFLSQDPLVRARALHIILRHRARNDSNLESSFAEESRKLVLDFLKMAPEAGKPDSEQSSAFANGITLLGMTGGGEKAIALLKSLDGKVPKYELSRQVALTRLGDKEAEKRLLEQYDKEEDLARKGGLAVALGQASTKACIERLAHDLRDDRKAANGTSLVQKVIGGLCRSRGFPLRDLRGKQGWYTQREYEAVEEWCAKELHMKWTAPKVQIQPPEIDID
jgi:hypothetical protein